MPIDFARALGGVLVASSLGLSLGACAEPLQNGGVVVFGGASARFDAMCRFRRGAEGGQSSCAPDASQASNAMASRISSESQLLKGPRAEGRVGDVLLTNNEISFVFSNETGFLLDAVDAHVGRDELAFSSSCVAEVGACLPLAPPVFGQEADGSAWVEVHLAEERSFDARTRYTLIPGARSLLVTTIVSTRSSLPEPSLQVGDLVKWGVAKPEVPPGQTHSFAAFVGADVAYAFVPADEHRGVTAEIFADGAYVRNAGNVVVSAGHPARYERVLAVAPRGDTLGVLTEVALMRDNQAPGAIEVKFVGADGAPIPPPPGGRVRLLSSAFPIEGYLAVGLSPEGPTVAGEAPPGKYEVEFDGAGRRALTRVVVEVRSGEITPVVLGLEMSPQLSPNTP
jgi:hypothetical protein